MPHRLPQPSDDVTAYLVLNDHGQFGIAYVETDPAEADRETIIRNFLNGQYSNALRVVAFNTAEGWSRDVSEDIADEVLERPSTRTTIWEKRPSGSLIGTLRRARSGRPRRRYAVTPGTKHDARPAAEVGIGIP
jgi:hypothetical protein